ncbi:MAG: CRTAC1 family protein [Bryobacteraceae bacterium]
MRFRLFPFALLVLAQPAGGPIAFEEIAVRAGLVFRADSCPTPNKNQPETMVAGVALLDYDNDGLLDVYLVNGAAIPLLEKESPRYFNRLFRNNGDLTFTDVTEKAGVAGAGYGMGAAAGDFDNDGWTDLYVANVNENQLFRNNGDGTFTDVTRRAGVAGGMHNGRKMWTVAAGWFDYDNDGRLDLFLSNYCVWEANKDPVCGPSAGLRAYCHPRMYDPLPNTLYRNNGDGTFTDVSAQTGIGRHFGKGMGVAFADADGDGFTDVFVANDTMPNFFFRNIGGKRFEESALAVGVSMTEDSRVLSGMGADFRDVDNDGRPDIWHTALEYETFPLFIAMPGGFTDATRTSGLARLTRPLSGWSNFIADLDNDGWKDLFVARANVLDNVERINGRPYSEPNSVFRNTGRSPVRFEDVSHLAGADFQVPAAHRGAAFGDLDNDGRLDAVVTVLNGQARLFHNVTRNGNHWLMLRLEGRKSNRMGLGATVRVETPGGMVLYNHATTSTGYAASSDPRVHFGLGADAVARRVEIRWPSGVRQVLENVGADRIVKVTEPAER